MPYEWKPYPDVTQMLELMLISVGIVGILTGVVATLVVQMLFSKREESKEQKKNAANDLERLKVFGGTLAYKIASEMPDEDQKGRWSARFALDHEELTCFAEALENALRDNRIEVNGYWNEKGKTIVEYRRIS